MSASCPKCNTVYDHSKKFCGKCGVSLNLDDSIPQQSLSVLNTFPSQSESIPPQTPQCAKSNPLKFIVIALVVIGMGYWGYNQLVNKKTNPIPASSPVSDNRTSSKIASPDEIQNFLNEWSQLQTNKNINGYLALYASDFRGVKRTISGKTTSYSYQQWVQDRSKMYQKAEDVSVTVDNVQITNSDNANGFISIEFMQHYNSNSYSDLGLKLIKLRKEGGSFKIVYEEMLNSQKVENPVTHSSNIQTNAPAMTESSDLEIAIKNFYQSVQDKRVDDAVNMFSAAKRPNIKVNLISSVAKDTEYYAIDSITINSSDGQVANTLVRLRHKKYKRPEEKWEINVTLVVEEGRWKIVSTPGNKVS